MLYQGQQLAMGGATLAPGLSSGQDGLLYGTKQTDSKDTVVYAMLSPEPSNQRHVGNEHRSAMAPAAIVAAHPTGAPSGQAPSSVNRGPPLMVSANATE